MKKILFIVKIFVASSLIISCDKYLDIVPDNVATLDYAFKDRVRAEQYLFTCYSYMPRHGLPQYPGMFDDFTWSHSGVDWLSQQGYVILRDGNNVTSPILDYWKGEGGATNLWQAIRDCNILIENIEKVRDMEETEKRRWAAEAKFLKAYYHFFLMQMYGPIPIVDENLPIDASPAEVAVYREPIDDVVDYISRTLDEAAEDLPLKIEMEVSELGRITKPIALAIKAKVLVTSASPLFNGNTDYATLKDKRGVQLFNQTADPNKWVKARDAAKEAIEICHEAGIQLYEFYNPSLGLSEKSKDILTIGRVVTDKWNVERIWGSGQFGNSRILEEYTMPALHADHRGFVRSVTVPTLKAVESFYSDKGVPIREDVTYDYANRYDIVNTGTSHSYMMQSNVQTAKLHLNREPRFYGSVGVDGGLWYGIGRYNDQDQWPLNVRFGQISGRASIERFSATSFFIKKLSNFESVYNVREYLNKRWDFPVFRLADLYLLYAEAENEVLDQPNNDVYKYVDEIRNRAGLQSVAASWSNYSVFPDKYQTKAGMRDIIRTERSIELAFEGHRFWDLRRWKVAIENFNQPIRGWNIEGSNVADFYRLRTINTLNYNLRDVFWPIKQGELSTNQNLVQNIGW